MKKEGSDSLAESLTESYPMDAEDDNFSYNKKSDVQRLSTTRVVVLDKIYAAVAKSVDVASPPPTTFNITDLGCSIEPNTFVAVHNIVDIVRIKYILSSPSRPAVPAFHVFFNDHFSNDVNTLLTSLPSERPYYAAAVSGSFHSRLFPDSYIHMAVSYNAVNWLSRVPEAVLDRASPAWNKGWVHYTSAHTQVGEAYYKQFIKDMGAFLRVRSKEIVKGGVLVLTMAGAIDGEPHSHFKMGIIFDLLAFCLMDMVIEGKIRKDKVDSFNIPIYAPSPTEMRKLVDWNGCFTIECLELYFSRNQMGSEMLTLHTRAGLEGMISDHFGSGIIDDLFDRYLNKAQENESLVNYTTKQGSQLIVILKRK